MILSGSETNSISDFDRIALIEADLLARRRLGLPIDKALLRAIPTLRSVMNQLAERLEDDLIPFTRADAIELIKIAIDALKCVRYSDRDANVLSLKASGDAKKLTDRLSREVDG